MISMNNNNGYNICSELKFLYDIHLKEKLCLNLNTFAMLFTTPDKARFLSEYHQTGWRLLFMGLYQLQKIWYSD